MIQLQNSKKDEKLEWVSKISKEATRTFIEAVNKKDYGVSFKAFTLNVSEEDEAKSIFDIVMTYVAMEIAVLDKQLIFEKTFYHTIEKDDSGFVLWLHSKDELPPTKEDIDKLDNKQSGTIELL